MQARAGAMDELLASGALDDASGQPNDDIARELDALSSGGDVDAELARMKGELSPASSPKAIDGTSDTSTPATEQTKQEDKA